jgi:peptidoglycan/LPS O-acetylase OafA/YrhL
MTDGPVPSCRTAPVPASTDTDRFHSLDALRAFALLLGVFFHAAESFAPGVETYWAIADSSTSPLLGVIRHACHSFRLELFFVMAGFFARLLYLRRGRREFIRNRLGRILVPLAVGWAVLYPLLVYLWLLGASVGGRLAQFGVPPDMVHVAPSLLTVGFFAKLQFLKTFDLTHLWFLHQLLVVYAVFLALRAVGIRWLDRDGHHLVRADRGMAALLATHWNVLLFALATIPMLLLMDSWGVDTPKSSLLPHGPTTLLFGFQFVLGWFLHRQPHLLEHSARGWWKPMLLGTAMVWPTGPGVEWLQHLGVDPARTAWVRLLHATLYSLMMWGLLLGFLGAFVRFRRTPGATWRYIADASYWIYIAHLPLVVWLQVKVGRWPLPWTVKYPLILAVAFPILFLSYKYLVRPTFIGQQLNGRRFPRRPTPATSP